MLSPGEMSREHLRALVKSMDPGATGKVGLRELVTFVSARQGGGGAGKAAKAAETGLKRCACNVFKDNHGKVWVRWKAVASEYSFSKSKKGLTGNQFRLHGN